MKKISGKLYIAENGQEGFELFKVYRPDIVITDLRMPIMNGIDMIKR
ncbi:response regulator [Clostridium botulinum]|nr:response regulator [Clostridium botulinum]